MTLATQTLDFISYFLTVYGISFMIITGVIGNIVNTLIFTQLKLFQRNPSAFSLTIVSIVDCCQLIVASVSLVTPNALNFDPARTSIVWCKFQEYVNRFTAISSISIVCFAAIDQYLSTSYYPRLRQISTFKLARRVIAILIIFTLSYSIPTAIFYEILPDFGCFSANRKFTYFNVFVHFCILFGILPVVISSLFSLLAYQNVRRLVRRQIPVVRRRLDRQLTAMILVRSALMIMTIAPFTLYLIYQNNSSYDQTNPFTTAIYQLILTTLVSIVYINFSGSFYLFVIISSRFRRQVKYMFVKKIWRKCLSIRANRVAVVGESQLPTADSHPSNIGNQ